MEYGVGGNVQGLAKYNNRLSQEAYNDISSNARNAAIKQFYQEEPRQLNGQRTYKQWQDKQDYLQSNSNALLKEVQKKEAAMPKPAKPGVPYWDAYSQGTKEYAKAQRQAESVERTVYNAEDAYSSALDKYGRNNSITEAAYKKYAKAVSSFENNYGYSPQEFD